MAKAATQSELNRFFQIRNQYDTPRQKVTATAFFKARLKFSAAAFVDLNQEVTRAVYEQIKPRPWKGHRVLAVDGVKSGQIRSSSEHQAAHGFGLFVVIFK